MQPSPEQPIDDGWTHWGSDGGGTNGGDGGVGGNGGSEGGAYIAQIFQPVREP